MTDNRQPPAQRLLPAIEGLPPAAVAQFRILQQRFVAGLPARWQEIDHAVSTTALQSALHRLAGSAGSYGFDGLAQLARRAEWVAQSGVPSDLPLALADLLRQIQQVQVLEPGDS